MLRREIGTGEVTYCATAGYLPYTVPLLCVEGNASVMLQPPVSIVTIQVRFERHHNRIKITS